MNYSLLLFDLDGTLVDSRWDLANAVNAMLQDCGAQALALDDVVDAVGDGVTVLIERCLRLAGESTIAVKEAKAVFVKHYANHLTDYTKPYEGVIETLAALDGIAKAVVTNKPEAISRDLLDALDLSGFFQLIVGGDTLPERKPSGLPVRHACTTLSVNPQQSLMVGDSVNDILAAKAAGTDSAAVLYGLQSEARLRKEQATHYLLSFRDLIGLKK